MAAQETTAGSNSASQTRHPNLILGAGTLIALINDYWNMQLDDLAIWEDHLLTAEEVVHVMNKGKKAADLMRVSECFKILKLHDLFQLKLLCFVYEYVHKISPICFIVS